MKHLCLLIILNFYTGSLLSLERKSEGLTPFEEDFEGGINPGDIFSWDDVAKAIGLLPSVMQYEATHILGEEAQSFSAHAMKKLASFVLTFLKDGFIEIQDKTPFREAMQKNNYFELKIFLVHYYLQLSKEEGFGNLSSKEHCHLASLFLKEFPEGLQTPEVEQVVTLLEMDVDEELKLATVLLYEYFIDEVAILASNRNELLKNGGDIQDIVEEKKGLVSGRMPWMFGELAKIVGFLWTQPVRDALAKYGIEEEATERRKKLDVDIVKLLFLMSREGKLQEFATKDSVPQKRLANIFAHFVASLTAKAEKIMVPPVRFVNSLQMAFEESIPEV